MEVEVEVAVEVELEIDADAGGTLGRSEAACQVRRQTCHRLFHLPPRNNGR